MNGRVWLTLVFGVTLSVGGFIFDHGNIAQAQSSHIAMQCDDQQCDLPGDKDKESQQEEHQKGD